MQYAVKNDGRHTRNSPQTQFVSHAVCHTRSLSLFLLNWVCAEYNLGHLWHDVEEKYAIYKYLVRIIIHIYKYQYL